MSLPPGCADAWCVRTETLTRGGTTVVSLAGCLDAYTAPDVHTTLTALITVDGPVVLDLAPLVFLDSEGARALAELVRTRAARGATTELADATGQPAFVLRAVARPLDLPVQAAAA